MQPHRCGGRHADLEALAEAPRVRICPERLERYAVQHSVRDDDEPVDLWRQLPQSVAKQCSPQLTCLAGAHTEGAVCRLPSNPVSAAT